MDSEVVNVIIAVAVIYFDVRWFTSGNSNNSGNASGSANVAKILGFKPKNVTPEMITSVRSAFPDIPTENIHYDLLRTGSVELTVNRLLERGYLDAPPAAYRRAFPPAPQTSTTSTATTTATKTTQAKPPTLIQRFNLESKVGTEPATSLNEAVSWDGSGPIPSAAKGKGKAVETIVSAGAASKWEATAEQRQQSLQQRKEAMILAARKRLLEKEAASSASTR